MNKHITNQDIASFETFKIIFKAIALLVFKITICIYGDNSPKVLKIKVQRKMRDRYNL
jgi:hypothetical protein